MPPDITPSSAVRNVKWTVMVFMGAGTIAGNESLIAAAEADLKEMRFVGSDGPLNIFVQVHQGGGIPPRRGVSRRIGRTESPAWSPFRTS